LYSYFKVYNGSEDFFVENFSSAAKRYRGENKFSGFKFKATFKPDQTIYFEMIASPVLSNVVKTKKSIHRLIEPNIIHVETEDGVVIDKDVALEGFKINLALNGGNPFCIILDMTKGLFQPTSEARKLYASEGICKYRLGCALIANNIASYLLGNFFIRINKPLSPVRIFQKGKEEEALEWLRSFLK
jgi:hypothetical protein